MSKKKFKKMSIDKVIRLYHNEEYKCHPVDIEKYNSNKKK